MNLPLFEHPDALPQNRHRGSVGGDAVDLDLGRSDHEVDVRLGVVEPGGLGILVARRPRPSTRAPRPTRCARPRSRRTACCGTRGRSRRRATTLSTSASSPRRRAPSSSAISARTRSSPRVARASTISPPASRSSRPSTIPPRSANGIVARTVPVGPHPVRAGEDLLGGHVRDVGLPGASCRGRPSTRTGDQPDLELGARPAVADALEPPLVERAARASSSSRRALQAAAGSASSSRITCAAAEAVAGLAQDLRRPPLRRERDDRPRDGALGRGLEPLVLGIGSRARDAGQIEALVDLGRAARDADQRRGVGGGASDAFGHPRGRELQRLVRAAGDLRPAQPRVAVQHVDIRGARGVGLVGDCARQVAVLDVGFDEQRLTGLDIGAGPHDELRVLLELGSTRRLRLTDPPLGRRRTARADDDGSRPPRRMRAMSRTRLAAGAALMTLAAAGSAQAAKPKLPPMPVLAHLRGAHLHAAAVRLQLPERPRRLQRPGRPWATTARARSSSP